MRFCTFWYKTVDRYAILKEGGICMNQNFTVTDIKRIILVGKDEYPEEKTSFSGYIAANELIFQFSGKSINYFGNQVLKIEPGTVRFLPKGDHGRYDIVREENGECIDVFFFTDQPISEKAFILDMRKNARVGNLFKKIFSLWVAKEEGYRFRCMSLLYEILSEIENVHAVPHRHSKKIQKAVDAIHEGFLAENFRVEELAALCHMKVSYFTRLFKELYGMPPAKYIIHLKLEYACELLRLDRYSITRVAALAGFSDVYFFSRQFKKYMGISPLGFKNKYKSSK